MPEPDVARRPDALTVSPGAPTVIYVLGAQRSGSTVLGVTLGNYDRVFFAGELHSWFSRHGVPSFGGEAGARLWKEIGDDVDGAVELFGHDTQLFIDRSSALFRPHRWLARRRLLPRYRRVTEDLFRAIARATGASHIVDTSHYPPRARVLQAIGGVDLHLLFLIRDPRAIVTSFDPRDSASGSKSVLNANAYLWVTYLLSLLVFLRHPRERRLLVRHEDFLADPEGILRQILDSAGCDAATPDLSALSTGSPLQGNRFLKRSDVITLNRGPVAVEGGSRLTAVLQAPWRWVFARLRPAAAPAAPDPAVIAPHRPTDGVAA